MSLPDPSIFALLPESNVLTAPSALLEAFLFIGFFLHIYAVNLVVGLALVLFLRLALPADGAPAGNDAFWLSKGLAFNINLAIVPLLFLQAMFAPFIYSSAIIMGLWLIAVPFFVMMAYYGLYLFNETANGPKGRNMAIMGVVLLIFLLVAFIYTNLNTLMLDPLLWPLGQGNPSGLALNLGDPSLWPRYLHNLLGMLAFGGLAQAGLAEIKIRRGGQGHEKTRRLGLAIFGHSTALGALTGVWYLFSTSAAVREAFLGGDAMSSAVLGLGAACSLAAIWTAAKGRLAGTIALASATLLGMCWLRHMMRKIMLAPYLESVNSKPFEVGPFVMFICATAATAAVLAIMLRKTMKSEAQAQNTEMEAQS